MPEMKNTSEAVPRSRGNRKARIVQSTEALLRERGLGGVTTRAIAEAVPCSEGAIYVHFRDRLELILAVLQESLPEMLTPLHALEQKLGTATPQKNLAAALTGLTAFHDRVLPMLCSLLTEPELLQRFRQSLSNSDKGPHRGIATLANYIEQEQQRGRIAPQIDAKTAASVLMASSFFYIFTSHLLGSPTRLDSKRLINFVINSSD